MILVSGHANNADHRDKTTEMQITIMTMTQSIIIVLRSLTLMVIIILAIDIIFAGKGRMVLSDEYMISNKIFDVQGFCRIWPTSAASRRARGGRTPLRGLAPMVRIPIGCVGPTLTALANATGAVKRRSLLRCLRSCRGWPWSS